MNSRLSRRNGTQVRDSRILVVELHRRKTERINENDGLNPDSHCYSAEMLKKVEKNSLLAATRLGGLHRRCQLPRPGR